MKQLTQQGLKWISALTIVLLVSACTSDVKLDESAQGANTGASTGAGGVSSGVDSGGVSGVAGVSTGGANGVGTGGASGVGPRGADKVIYFDFDSFQIRSEYNTTLDTHAQFLRNRGEQRVVVEGHTDSSGGREYNLALGQKRAEAVRRSLTLLGVPDRQLEAVSFGEERPAVGGLDEASMSKNRRAELNYR